MLSRETVLRCIVAIALSCVTGCQANGGASLSPAGQTPRGTSAIEKGGCQPDFTLSLSPATGTITSGQNVRIAVQLTSICSLAGSINVGIHGITPQPRGGDGFSIAQNRYDIPLDANSSAVAYITLGATPETLKTTWIITIQGKDVSGGCCYGLTHSAEFALTVR